jgi:hypothetical protein
VFDEIQNTRNIYDIILGENEKQEKLFK